jgi:ketosteroid isomerase-like protein
MNRRTVALVACFLFVSAASGFAANTLEDELRAATKSYREALVRKHTVALEKIWTDDYTFIDAHGRVQTKAERLADLHSAATKLDSIRHDVPATIRIHGDVGIVTSTVTITGRYKGKDVAGDFRSTHLWVHGPDGWRLLMNQLTAVQK